jgi:hypothetical protein
MCCMSANVIHNSGATSSFCPPPPPLISSTATMSTTTRPCTLPKGRQNKSPLSFARYQLAHYRLCASDCALSSCSNPPCTPHRRAASHALSVTTGPSACTAHRSVRPEPSSYQFFPPNSLCNLLMSAQIDSRVLLSGMHGRGVVSVQRLLWLEYEVEGEEGQGVRQRLEQQLLSGDSRDVCPHDSKSKL